MKTKKTFFKKNYIESYQRILKQFVSNAKSQNLNIKALQQMYQKPYIPANQLSKKFCINKNDLLRTNEFIQRFENSQKLFEYSPYPYFIHTIRQLSRNEEKTQKIINGEDPTPLVESLELFISETCNAQCKFCYRDNATYNHNDEKVLSNSQYEQIINNFADLNGTDLDVTGGLEPLLSPALPTILKTGTKRNLNVHLYTNGIALGDNNEVTQQILNIQKVRVSLNASNKKSYKEIMRVDKFNQVIENLKQLIETKKKTKSKVKIGVGFATFKQNYTDLFDVVNIAQILELDFLDLRAVEVTDMERLDQNQRTELKSILTQIRQAKMQNAYEPLQVSVADTFNDLIDPENDSMNYIKKELVKELSHFRITVTPYGQVYALNLIGQPSREDDRFLLGKIQDNPDFSKMLKNKRNIPYERKSLLAHDMTLLSALSKIDNDLEFGLSLKENPFNWAT